MHLFPVMRRFLSGSLAATAIFAVSPAWAQDGLRPVPASTGLYPRGTATLPTGVSDPGALPERGLSLAPINGQGFSFARSPMFDHSLRLPAGFEASDAGASRTFGLGTPAGSTLDYRFNRWTLSSSLRQGLATMRPGTSRLDLGASYGFNVAPRHQIVLFGGMGFGASPGMQVDANNDVALLSALRPYATGSGVRDMGMRLSWRYILDRRLFIDTSIGYERQLGEGPEGASGLDRNVSSVGALFGYRFY
jgi:hypothetical protein